MDFGPVPRIDTGAVPWIPSLIPSRRLGSILERRLGFCLVFRSCKLDQYWCGASDSVFGPGPAPGILSRASVSRLGFSFSGAAPRILSCVPVRRFGSCLVFRSGASDQYWCGVWDSISGSGPAPWFNTVAGPWILSLIPVWHLGSIPVRRLGFCLGFWCGASDSVLGCGPACQTNTGAESRILSWISVRHLASILVRRLGFSLVFRSGISD